MRPLGLRAALLVSLGFAAAAPAHESPAIALRLDVDSSGRVFVEQIAGPRALVALEPPAGCRLELGRTSSSLETSRDLPARVHCTSDGLHGTWRVSGLGSHAQAMAVRAEGAVTGTWTLLPESSTFSLAEAPVEGAATNGPGSGTRPPFDPRPALAAGASHVAHGLDHMALVALLVVSAARLRHALLPLVGFTLAHALTLGFGAFGHPLMPARLAELLVAASLVLATRLESSERLGARTITAFTFGLVHGVAFLEGAAPLLAHGHAPIATLAAFHVGIEFVQVAVALALAAVLAAAELRESFAQRLRASVATLAGAYGVALLLARLA